MKAIFDELFGAENVSPIVRWQHASQIMAQMETKTMITGHFWHSPGSLAHRRRAYLTILRRPEDRVLSLYSFFRHNVQDVDDKVVQLAKTLPLAEFLMSEDPVITQAIQNSTVRHFRQLSLHGYSAAKDNPQLLTAAKEVVDQYDFVGIHEEFADSLDLMSYRFDWPAVETIPTINRARERLGPSDLDPALRARLHELSLLDVELYEHARGLFAARRRAMVRRFIDLRGAASPAERGDVHQPAAPASSAIPSIEFGDRTVELLGVEVRGTLSGTPVLVTGEPAVIAVTALAHGASDDFTVGIAIRDASRRLVFGTNSHHLGEKWDARPGMVYEIELRMPMTLGDGVYFVTVALHEGPTHFTRCFHWREDAAPFEVRGRRGNYFRGVVDLAPTLTRRESPPLGVFSAGLTATAPSRRIAAAASFLVPVRIKNTGDQTWPASGRRAVNASYRWLDDAGRLIVDGGLRTPLPHDMHGGDETSLQLGVRAPHDPGAYVLRITLVQETWAWFDAQGSPPLDLPISIGL